MSTRSQSPIRVARQALVTGTQALPRYAHPFRPTKYTQPQLFAGLVLKTFFQTDYRGRTALRHDHSDLRTVLSLRHVPHFTTLPQARRRWLRLPKARRLLATTVRRFRRRRRRVRRAACDAPGLDGGRRRPYHVRRRGGTPKRWQTVVYSRFAQRERSRDCSSHLLLAVGGGRGPRGEGDRFVPLVDATLEQVQLHAAWAAAGDDAEANHRSARETKQVRSFIPAQMGRPTAKRPSGRYRRQMKQRLRKDYGPYGQRWQAETGISMRKRRLASSVNGHTYGSQCREVGLLAITYNLMLC